MKVKMRDDKEALKKLLFESTAVKDEGIKSLSSYVIVDTSQNEKILLKLMASKGQYLTILNDTVFDFLEEVSPYILLMDKDDRISIDLIDKHLDDTNLLFFQSEYGLEALADYFKSFTLVSHPEEGKVIFNFYVPQVFRDFVETISADRAKIKEFFLPVMTYIVRSEEITGTLCCFCAINDYQDVLIESILDHVESGITPSREKMLASKTHIEISKNQLNHFDQLSRARFAITHLHKSIKMGFKSDMSLLELEINAKEYAEEAHQLKLTSEAEMSRFLLIRYTLNKSLSGYRKMLLEAESQSEKIEVLDTLLDKIY